MLSLQKLFNPSLVLILIICSRYSHAFANTDIHVTICLLWGGQNLKKENNNALANIRHTKPYLNFLHFISPRYFIQSDSESNKNYLKSSISENNEDIGLLLSAWKDLVVTSGVKYRQEVSFWHDFATQSFCEENCGNDVPISSYKENEISKILRHQAKFLTNELEIRPKALYINGWMGTEIILDFASQIGFQTDFSAIPPKLVEEKIAFQPLKGFIATLWKEKTIHSIPLTKTFNKRKIVQITQNLGNVDYIRISQLKNSLDKLMRSWIYAPPPQKHLIFSIHQETLAFNIFKFKAMIEIMEEKANQFGFGLSFNGQQEVFTIGEPISQLKSKFSQF